ncbi:MAG: hypothetical protein NVS2B16_31410 [Chloroflexota bacterium]
MHTLAAHPITVAGAILLAVGLLLYLGSIALSMAQVQRQYSPAMPGRTRMRTGSGFAAAGKFWPFLGVAILGAGLLLAGR